MKTPLGSFVVDIDWLRCEVLVLIGARQAEYFINENIFDDKEQVDWFKDKFKTSNGLAISFKKYACPYFVLYIQDRDDITTIVRESFHITNMVLSHNGVEYRDDSPNETHAHLLGWLVEKVLLWCKIPKITDRKDNNTPFSDKKSCQHYAEE